MGQLAMTLEQLSAGTISMDEAAARIRKMKPVRHPEPPVLDRMGAADDPWGTPVPDDGHELTYARSDGRITPEQYAILYQAWTHALAANPAPD